MSLLTRQDASCDFPNDFAGFPTACTTACTNPEDVDLSALVQALSHLSPGQRLQLAELLLKDTPPA
jgi:hypothetical protein